MIFEKKKILCGIMNPREGFDLQKLAFEPAWDRTLAHQDRLEIVRVFSKIDHDQKVGQQAVVMKTAFNHKEEFLVTVLVSNYAEEPFTLEGKNVLYNEEGITICEMESSYSLEISAKTSMPWTFIFPSSALRKMPAGEFGECIII